MAVGVTLPKLLRNHRTAVYHVEQLAFSDSNHGSQTTTSASQRPTDPYKFVGFTMFLLGIASLLPWNFFITANDYWNYKFRDPNVPANSTEKTELQRSFNAYLAIASKLPYILFLVVNTAISKWVRCSLRVGYPLLGCTLLFIATAALVKVNTDNYQNEFLIATLVIVVLINVVCGFLQGGATGLAGVLPEKYMAINVLGQATGGVFATLCQLATLLFDAHPTDAALVYFGIAVIVLILTQILFGILINTEFYRYYMHQSPPVSVSEKTASAPAMKTPFWAIFVAGWKFYVATVLIFWVTLAAFPAITALIAPVSEVVTTSPLMQKLFVTLACFVTFNFTDLFGRLLAKHVRVSAKHDTGILLMAAGRAIFIPLLLICNVDPSNRYWTPVLLQSDWAFVIIMMLFGLTNGYLTTFTLTYASKSCSKEYQEVAGSLAAVFLGIGLALGSLSSYGTVQLL